MSVWTPPSSFPSGEVASGDFNDQVIGNLLYLKDQVDDVDAAWATFTPTFRLGTTNLTVGNATRTGRYRTIGSNLLFFRARLVYGSTSSWPANDTMNMLLPDSMQDGATAGRVIAGAVRVEDVSVPARGRGHLEIGVAGDAVVFDNYDATGFWTGTQPIAAWGTGDTLDLAGWIELA